MKNVFGEGASEEELDKIRLQRGVTPKDTPPEGLDEEITEELFEKADHKELKVEVFLVIHRDELALLVCVLSLRPSTFVCGSAVADGCGL